MAKGKKTVTEKLKDYSKSREYFGAYNDPRLKEKSNFATQYVKKHANIINRNEIKNVYKRQADLAKKKLDSELGMSDEEFFKLLKTFEDAQEAFSPRILGFTQTAYPAMGGIIGAVNNIRNGRVKGQDITKSINDFELVMYRLMNAISIGVGMEGIDFKGKKAVSDITPSEMSRLLEGKEAVYTWLQKDAKGAATSLKNLFDNYNLFVDSYKKGEENKNIWKTSTSVKKIDEKSAGSIYMTTLKAIQSVQGGIGEYVMAEEIAKAMSTLDEELGSMVKVEGGKTTTAGVFQKGDVSVPYRASGDNIIDVQVNAKAKTLKPDNKTRIPFEGGKGNSKHYFDKYGLGNLYAPYTILSHYRNINGGFRGMNTDLYNISGLIGAEYAINAFGVSGGAHFLAFVNKILPTYKLLEEMSEGGYELHIGANEDKFMKYPGKYSQSDAFREYQDFKGGSKPSWSNYQSFIEQKSNNIKRTQFILGYRK